MEPPEAPGASDCCNSGCNPCILDAYEAQLKKYKETCAKSQSKQLQHINAISPTSYTNFKLVGRKQVSESAFLFTFEHDDERHHSATCVQYNPGQYFMLKATDRNGEFTRSYTPIPINDDSLSFTILVRLYNTGRMSELLKKLALGVKTQWRGPYGDYCIKTRYKYVLFIAQGVGIAPIYAIIARMVHDEDCDNFLMLFYCCRSCGDIFLRDKLYEFSSFWNFRYEIFVCDTSDLTRKYNETVHETKLDSTHLSSYIRGKVDLLRTVICGSEGFCTNITAQLVGLGVDNKQIYSF